MIPVLQLVGICTVQRSSDDSSFDVPIKSKVKQLCASRRALEIKPCYNKNQRLNSCVPAVEHWISNHAIIKSKVKQLCASRRALDIKPCYNKIKG